MNDQTVYIIGCGAIGFPLAAFLTNMGRNVVAVRSSLSLQSGHTSLITTHQQDDIAQTLVPVISLDKLTDTAGVYVITSKSTANHDIAERLKTIGVKGPIIIMQNGLDVEDAFIERGFEDIYRTVLYFTSETKENYNYSIIPVKASPIGIVKGSPGQFNDTVSLLQNPTLTLDPTDNIAAHAWQKTIANVVYNSLCPLLNQDNGIFHRESKAMVLADELIRECLIVAHAIGVNLEYELIRNQVLSISKASDGLLISTLQDLNAGRRTEMDYINLAIARKANSYGLSSSVPRINLLGQLVLLKEQLGLRPEIG